MASGDSGTASDSSNIGSTLGAYIGGAIGLLPDQRCQSSVLHWLHLLGQQ